MDQSGSAWMTAYDSEMSPEKREMLAQIGASIRLSELPDEVVVTQVVIDIIHGIAKQGMQVTGSELGEMLAFAFVTLGDFHRLGSCKW